MPIKKIKNRKVKHKQPAEKPLTLSSLVRYNNKVFLPAIELRFATKTDLNELKIDLSEFKEEVNSRFDDTANTLDHILHNTESINQEHTIQINTNQRADKKIENHEKRINKLEVAVK